MRGRRKRGEKERETLGTMTGAAVACCSAVMQRGEHVGGTEGRCEGEWRRTRVGWGEEANVPLLSRYDEMSNAGTKESENTEMNTSRW